ncbi:formamidopyrimidine-DNA glycosylase, putative, partial [Acidithiobacillus sp. GGI-221]
MAELPEIELLRQKLRRNILHKRVGVMQRMPRARHFRMVPASKMPHSKAGP